MTPTRSGFASFHARFVFVTMGLIASAVTAGGCSKNQSGSELIDMSVSGNGIILQTSSQSCVDKTTGGSPPTRSLSAPSLYFSGLTVKWKPTSLELYVGDLRVTVTSSHLSGGTYQVDLDPTEVEALLGATNATLSRATDASTPHVYASSDSSSVKEKSGAGLSLASCGLGIGGLALADPTSTAQFTAQVKIDLIGTAYNSQDANATQQVVRQSISTSATYY